jgi:hypothetical protein
VGEAEKLRTAMAQEESDKRQKIAEDEAKKLVDQQKAATRELIDLANSLGRGTASAFYDAAVISNEALRESGKTRSQMLKQGIKDTAAAIAKEAILKAAWEGAMFIAALAMGNPKAGLHLKAAAAFAAVGGVALATSKGISAGGASGPARATREDLSNRRATGGTEGAQTRVINIYWPEGMFLGDRDTLIRTIHEMENDAERRGRL